MCLKVRTRFLLFRRPQSRRWVSVPPSGYLKKCRLLSKPQNSSKAACTSTPSPVGEGRREGKTTAPVSDDPQTQGRLKSPANPNPVSGNRLKEYNGIEYTYDALGNLIYRQLPDGENQYYQYDLENQLVRAEIKKPAGNTEIWEYAYDPFGRRLSKERQDKLAWTSTDPKRTHFVWDGTRLLQEYTYKGSYTYIYTDQDSYEPLAQVFDNAKDGKQYLAYFHNDQIGIPREMTDIHGNLLWYGEYTAWGRLKKDERVYRNAHQPFRLQNQYYDEETGLHYNLMRYYEAETGRFVNQDPIGLLGGENLYSFAPNVQGWIDVWGLAKIFRGMKDDGGYPKIESSARGLGVREGIDITVDANGMVEPGKNGMSMSPSPQDLPSHRRPPEFGGTGKDPVWQIDTSDLGDDLKYVPDKPGHGTIQPSKKMTLERYKQALGSLRRKFRKVGCDNV